LSTPAAPPQDVTRGVLAIPAFRKLWNSMVFSPLDDWLGLLATTALAQQLSVGSYATANFAIAGVFIARLLPAVFLGPLAGVIVLPPARTNATARRRNSAGYILGIIKAFHKRSDLHYKLGNQTVGQVIYKLDRVSKEGSSYDKTLSPEVSRQHRKSLSCMPNFYVSGSSWFWYLSHGTESRNMIYFFLT
jgi:hypothetical protein